MMPSSAGGMPPMGGGMPSPGGVSAGAPQGQGGEQPSKQEVQQMLTEILTQAKQLADQYGIDLASMIPSGGSPGVTPMGEAPGSSALPPPPSSPMPV